MPISWIENATHPGWISGLFFRPMTLPDCCNTNTIIDIKTNDYEMIYVLFSSGKCCTFPIEYCDGYAQAPELSMLEFDHFINDIVLVKQSYRGFNFEPCMYINYDNNIHGFFVQARNSVRKLCDIPDLGNDRIDNVIDKNSCLMKDDEENSYICATFTTLYGNIYELNTRKKPNHLKRLDYFDSIPPMPKNILSIKNARTRY